MAGNPQPGIYDITAGGDFSEASRFAVLRGFTLSSMLDAVPQPSAADFDNNGLIDGDDLFAWKTNFGLVGAVRSQGDANVDGIVDGADYLVWQQQVGASLAMQRTPAVPEGSLRPMLLLGFGFLSRWQGRSAN